MKKHLLQQTCSRCLCKGQGFWKAALKLDNRAGSSCLACRDRSFMICNWEQVNHYLWCTSLEHFAQNRLIILRAVFENKALVQQLTGELGQGFDSFHFLSFLSKDKILMKRWLVAGLCCVFLFVAVSRCCWVLFLKDSLPRTHPFFCRMCFLLQSCSLDKNGKIYLMWLASAKLLY